MVLEGVNEKARYSPGASRQVNALALFDHIGEAEKSLVSSQSAMFHALMRVRVLIES